MRKASTQKRGAQKSTRKAARPTVQDTAQDTAAALPKFYQTEDVAKMTGLKVTTVRRALREGRLAGAHHGRNYIISAPDLAAWYTENGGKSAGL